MSGGEIAAAAFRTAWKNATGTAAARDVAAVLDALRRGLTAPQIRAAWRAVDPSKAAEAATAYVGRVIAHARTLLRRERRPPPSAPTM